MIFAIPPLQLRPGSSTNAPANRIEVGSVVEYEQHGKPLLAVAVLEKKGKWLLINETGQELELPPARLYLLPGKAPSIPQSKTYLAQLSERANDLQAQVDLADVWQLLLGGSQELTTKELAELAFNSNGIAEHLATRRALFEDRVYFKRKKIGFEPRSAEVVEELRLRVAAEEEAAKRREETIKYLLNTLQTAKPAEDFIRGTGDTHENLADAAPAQHAATLEQIAQLAALGKSAPDATATAALVDDVLQRAGIQTKGHLDDRAFDLLRRLGRFSEHENLSLIRFRRSRGFTTAVLDEVDKLANSSEPETRDREDLTALTTITIDDESTKDVDDALSLELTASGFRVGIHIADVAALIKPGMLLDREAANRAISVYCPDCTVPMLPRVLSEDKLSLHQEMKRPVMSFFIDLDDDFRIVGRRVLRASIKVQHRLSYNQVDEFLFGEITSPPWDENVSKMLSRLWEIAGALEARRITENAIQFSRRELTPRILDDGTIALETTNEDTPAHKLVSELMIIANEAGALFASEQKIPLIFRSQDPPDVDPTTAGQEVPEGPAREYLRRGILKRSVVQLDPASHFGLGLPAYAQMTSPIRRYADLVNQRQIGAVLDGEPPPYNREALTELVGATEASLSEVQQLQRERTRYWLLCYLLQEKITRFQATVVRTDGPRPLAELEIIYSLMPFTPLSGKQTFKPGDHVLLAVTAINPRKDIFQLSEVAE